jgi:hypothetical protein
MSLPILPFTLLSVLCLTQVGCLETPAEKAITGNHPNAHIGRGGPRGGYPWVVYPDVLAKWIREIPQIAKGTSADDVIRRMGEPDGDYENAPVWFFPPNPPADRCVEYFVAMDDPFKGAPVNFPSNLVSIESINLVFGPDNRYKTYWVENPLHHRNLNTTLGAPITPDQLFDQDLTSLMLAGPAASTRPTGGQPSP